MEPIGDIAGQLPAPRDDEPESLRTDIIDELTDHLECAFNRELHTPASGRREATDSDPESSARQRALARFGNPAAIARRLWYDAMQDRIMSQRLTMGAAIVAVCACLGMLAVMWRSIGTQQQHIDALTLQMHEDADEAARQRDELQALLAESQEANRELAETVTARLSSMEQRAAETSEWNPVEFRLVQGGEDGPPAVGFSVELAPFNESGETEPFSAEQRKSDETGVVRFEHVRYGRYAVTISAPWREYKGRILNLELGETCSETIVCPAAAPESLDVMLAVEWPDDLAELPIFLRVAPESTFRLVGGTTAWATSRSADTFRGFGSRWRPRQEYVFVSPTGVIHNLPNRRDPRTTFLHEAGGNLVVPDDPVQRTIHWPGREYRVLEIAFLAPVSQEDRARYAAGESMPAGTSLERIDNATLRATETHPLEWRIEDGSPARIVYEPTDEIVTAVREYFAGLDSQDADSAGDAGLLRMPDRGTEPATAEP